MEKVSLVCGTSLEAVGAKSKAGSGGLSKVQSLVWTVPSLQLSVLSSSPVIPIKQNFKSVLPDTWGGGDQLRPSRQLGWAESDKGAVNLRRAQSRSEESQLPLSRPLEQPGAARVEGLGEDCGGSRKPGSIPQSLPLQLSNRGEEVESPLSPEIRNRQQLTRGSK